MIPKSGDASVRLCGINKFEQRKIWKGAIALELPLLPIVSAGEEWDEKLFPAVPNGCKLCISCKLLQPFRQMCNIGLMSQLLCPIGLLRLIAFTGGCFFWYTCSTSSSNRLAVADLNRDELGRQAKV